MSEIKLNYHKTHFLTSAPNIRSIPEDTGIEIALFIISNYFFMILVIPISIFV